MCKSKIMPFNEDVKHLQIPLHEIKLATNGFSKENLIGMGGFGYVYKGLSEKHGVVAVKRWDCRYGQGDNEFITEIGLLPKYQHANVVSLLGFCDEDDEKILVYKYESNGSLDKHLKNEDLTWIQRLRICLDAARGLKHVHYKVGSQLGIFHRDIKSSNILLDSKWKAKISDFGLSKARSAYSQSSFVTSNPCGTPGYVDPNYLINGYLTQKSDVYSFGVVMWEVLCGKLVSHNHGLPILAERHYNRQTLDEIIPSYLYNQIDKDSLLEFSKIAYQCLKNGEERPTMTQVVEQLEKALHAQQEVNKSEEAKPTGDNKNDEESKDHTQEIVLRVVMHCQGSARKIRKCLRGFKGVETVHTDCETQQLVVKGEKVDPLKVLERVREESRYEVILLSPVPKSQTDEPKEQEQEEKKDELGNMVVLKVPMHCESCARDIKKCIEMIKGVESAIPDLNNSQVVVKGTFSAEEILDCVLKKASKKARKNVMIVTQGPTTTLS